MHAIVINRYGSPEVLKYTTLDMPKPKKGEVLVKVKASSINPIDFKVRQGALKLVMRKKFPITLGHDIAGEIQEVGIDSNKFKVGDKVYGMNPFPGMGAYAEYVAVSGKYLALAPSSIDENKAAAVPLAAITALQSLRDKGGLKKGQKVLINGASGGVGTFAVQIAKAMGATVYGVCSTSNVETVRELGADQVIDYKQQNFEKLLEQFDIVFDAVGKSSFLKCRSILTSKGVYVSTAPRPDNFLWSGLSVFMPRKVKLVWTDPNTEDLNVLANYIDNGLIKPIIDKVYNYDEMQQAQRDAEKDRTVGKKIVKINPSTDRSILTP